MKWVKPKTYTNPVYPYKRSSDQDTDSPKRHKVVIVGAGPTGLMAALDLASRDIPVVVLTKENTVVVGSRAICFSKKTLEIANRLKVADRMLEKGVVWNVGKVFYQNDLVYQFDLLPEDGHKVPAFINLQQYYFEEYLVDAANQHPLIDIRWKHEWISLNQTDESVELKVNTPEGTYKIIADYLLACDGVHSPVRKQLGLAYEGEKFEENFLIADITMENDFPKERWFWFDPPFNKGYSALLHKQPDGVWRIDLQLGWDIDKEKELDPTRIRQRLKQMLGEEVKFELEWTSIYQFRCMRMEDFVHGRVIFAGDSAHLVSPFGARGANGGVQDTDNLIWKLAYVLKDWAPESLLHTYQLERSPAADENIFHSSNATDFISPKSEVSMLFRNAVLDLAKEKAFARELVNSGRLSHAFSYLNSPLTSQDSDTSWKGTMQPGKSVSDVALMNNGKSTQLIDALGNDFSLILYHTNENERQTFVSQLGNEAKIPLKIIQVGEKDSRFFNDPDGKLKEKYDLQKASWYLIRPDHYIAARGRSFDKHAILTAIENALHLNPVMHMRWVEDNAPKYAFDEVYKKLIDLHKGRSKTESDQLNAKLILALMAEVGDKQKLKKLLDL